VSKLIDRKLTKDLHRALAPLRSEAAGDYITRQIGVAEFRSQIDNTPTKEKDKTYKDNKHFWRDVISGRLKANTVISLTDFALTEWVPWAPGAFHADGAENARAVAWRHRLSNNIVDPRRELYMHLHSNVPGPDSDFVIFAPEGKLSMIQGGVGCMRLQSVELRSREEVWLMGATSSSIVHEGILLAMNNDLYNRLIDDISSGGLRCERIIGRIRFARNLDQLVFRTKIPKVYVEIERIEVKPKRLFMGRSAVSCLVCAAVGFESAYEGRNRLYVTYASFSSDNKSSLDDAVEWMDREYVRGFYGGKIVTDFDEQSSRFSGAVFGLSKVMKDGININDARKLMISISEQWSAERVIEAIERAKSITIERVENMTMKTVRIGNNNTISAPITIADQIQGSFHAISKSNQDSETKEILERLVRAVAELSPLLPAADAKSLARDTDDVVREATASEPRKEVCKSLLERISKAATAVGEIAAPVATVVAALIKLYSGG
jgi:hypothetical protein